MGAEPGRSRSRGTNELDTVDPGGRHLRRIRFVFLRAVPPEQGDTAIFSSRTDGRGQRLLIDAFRSFGVFGDYVANPAFSLDGTKIAFTSLGFAGSACTMRSDGTGVRPLYPCSPDRAGACEVRTVDWAPDGRRVALGVSIPPFGSRREGEQVVVVNADGSGATVLRPGSTPFWSPDGHKLAPSSGQLWRSDGTTRGTKLVTDIHPGRRDSSPESLTNVGGTIFFAANDGVHGAELWKTTPRIR